MAETIQIKPVEIVNLPSYFTSRLNDDSLVVCKMIENYFGTNLYGNLISLKAGYSYVLSFKLVRTLQKNGLCYFVEKIEGATDG